MSSVLRIAIVVSLLSLGGGCTSEPDEMDPIERKTRLRSSKVDLSGIKDWSLSLDGTPFKGNRHEWTLGEKIHFVGTLELENPLRLPQFFLISLRPQGEMTGEDWMMLDVDDSNLEMSMITINSGRTDISIEASARKLSAGEYDARLYFYVNDLIGEGRRSSLQLLATGEVVVKA